MPAPAPSGFSIPEFLKGWGSLITATIALAQPWAIGLLNKKRGTIDAFPTGNIELGYSVFGPTVGLFGTILSVHRDQFVSLMSVEIVREKDSSRHSLEWKALRNTVIAFGKPSETTFELPAGYFLSTSQSQKYNVIFNDAAVERDILPLMDELRRDWIASVKTVTPGETLEPVEARKIYTDVFTKEVAYRRASVDLERMCYWEPGSYRLTLKTITSRPDRTITHSWKFTVNKDQSEVLRQNVAPLMQQVCCEVETAYNFVYIPYEKA